MSLLSKTCALLLTGSLLGAAAPVGTRFLPPSAAPGTATAATTSLSPRLQRVASVIRGDAPRSVYFADLKTGTGFFQHDQQLSSASMIKVFILAKAYDEIRTGNLSREETFVLSKDNVVSGSGDLQYEPLGTKLSLKQVLEAMIVESDNTATNILIDRLGMDAINAYMQGHGYSKSVLRRKMMDYDAIAAGRDNLTSVKDVGLLFKRLYRGQCVSPELDAEMLAIYKKQTDNDKIPAGVPKGTIVAHKTGEVNDVRHDGGIVYTPKGDYVLCIFTTGYCPYSEMAGLSGRIYQAFLGE